MSIDGITQQQACDMPAIATPTSANVSHNKEPEFASTLAHITNAASFSPVAQKLQSLLDHITQPGNNIINTLASNVEQLQDGFVDTLYATMRANNVDLSEKITLRLDTKAHLQVINEHPHKESINAFLAAAPDLSKAFSEIASQSATLNEIQKLQTIVHRRTANKQYAATQTASPENSYQVSLKGEMNHFYFSNT